MPSNVKYMYQNISRWFAQIKHCRHFLLIDKLLIFEAQFYQLQNFQTDVQPKF